MPLILSMSKDREPAPYSETSSLKTTNLGEVKENVMASGQRTVDLIVEQMSGAGAVHAKKMFGEYAIFHDGRMVALICDDRLFIKPTNAGRAHIGTIVEAPPYKGAKPYFVIDGDQWDDAEWMAALVRLTAAELPLPKKKKAKETSERPAARDAKISLL